MKTHLYTNPEEIFTLARQTNIVDIGANPIDGDPPYKSMLQSGLCHVYGFEPQPHALAQLLSVKSKNETYLPDAIGDGNPHTLHITSATGMVSLLKPDQRQLDLFEGFSEWGRITKEETIQTKRLDDLEAISHIDLLKIDIQGAELMVFQNGRQKLKEAVFIQTEVSFVNLYKNQASLGDIDLEMRLQGFIPHTFVSIKNWPVKTSWNKHQGKQFNQLLEADIVYIKDIAYPENFTNSQLMHMAMIAHHIYKSFDLAAWAIKELEKRSIIKKGTYQYINQYQH
ncbi:FkbM family methyltransferase [Flavobacterium sp. 90]|uniref:FkbM family methyltransferase n=1 Tax=unclassified Flavobacterium TaxID=196869 RepID=UPI000EAE8CF3|nr:MULTISPECIES: FkbM family methyltransferase [unclassified Flavobacterium]RKR11437.1 FkbM family methyltransferase [Flavobacterium sp. 81]TCK55218.1 FkbM family methyltransferase [Flavobacterium sp. 90]